MKEKPRGTFGGEKRSSKVFVENKQPQKNITGRFLSGGAEKEKENKKEMWVEDKKEIEGVKEEREVLSCMTGVSGRFLCDIQVEAWT